VVLKRVLHDLKHDRDDPCHPKVAQDERLGPPSDRMCDHKHVHALPDRLEIKAAVLRVRLFGKGHAERGVDVLEQLTRIVHVLEEQVHQKHFVKDRDGEHATPDNRVRAHKGPCTVFSRSLAHVITGERGTLPFGNWTIPISTNTSAAASRPHLLLTTNESLSPVKRAT